MVRALALDLEEDGEELLRMESDVRRWMDRDEELAEKGRERSKFDQRRRRA